jgi:type VI secretion system protein ImpH
MANPSRNAKSCVAELLYRETYRFTFLQAVRLLRHLAALNGTPGGELGSDVHPNEEYVRLIGTPSRTFPGAEILQLLVAENRQDATPSESGEFADLKTVPMMVTTFMGLYGPLGVLPQHDTQRIINNVLRSGAKKGKSGNPEKEFLDLFTHRLLSLFYRASTKYRVPLAFEAFCRGNEDELFSRSLFSVAGFGTRGLKSRQVFDDSIIVQYANNFAVRAKNAISLTNMLSEVFRVTVQVQQFVGQWLELDSDSQSLMPTLGNPLGRNCLLGQSIIIGDRIWDIQGKFRICLGPLNYAGFETFLEGSEKLTALAQLVRTAVGVQYDFDVQLELLAEDIPECGLAGGARLGQNSWLISKTPARNSTDAIMAVNGFPLPLQIAG